MFQERHISALWCDNDGWSLNLTDCKESFLILLEVGYARYNCTNYHLISECTTKVRIATLYCLKTP